jgi:hypothetical protein
VPEIRFSEDDGERSSVSSRSTTQTASSRPRRTSAPSPGHCGSKLTAEIREDVARHARGGLLLRHLIETFKPQARKEMEDGFYEALGGLENRMYRHMFLNEEIVQKLGDLAWQAKNEALEEAREHETV